MKAVSANALLLVSLLLAPAALARAAGATTAVSEVTVHMPRDPKVTGSYPVDGAAIPFGLTVIKLAFDQPMTPEAWSYAAAPGGLFPDCLARPRLLVDQKTVALLCTLPAGKSFAMAVNAAPGFVSEGGRAVKPFLLRFTTTQETTPTMHAALTQAGLTDADDPIMDWNGAAGVSKSLPPAREPGAP